MQGLISEYIHTILSIYFKINQKRITASVLVYLTLVLSRGREFDPGPVPYFRGD